VNLVAADQYDIQMFGEQDISAACRLCRAAGWNQLPEDWRRLLDYEPEGCFTATIQGRLIGTVTTTTYGNRLGWIGMMLVDPDYRRRGIATALMRRAVEYLNQRQVQCIKLDASPEGLPVYARLGFVPEWSFHRWRRADDLSCTASDTDCGADPAARIERSGEVVSCLPDELAALDEAAFGVNRSRLLNELLEVSEVEISHGGYGMLRPGFLASYLGPVVAEDEGVGRSVINSLLGRVSGTVFWDIPGPNRAAAVLAESLGFEPVRELTRMRLGDGQVAANTQLQFALVDPGTG
jgi:GNAT superfamily N-acetyltransferase